MLLITCLYGAHLSPQARSVGVEKASQKVRIALKTLKTLIVICVYSCRNVDELAVICTGYH